MVQALQAAKAQGIELPEDFLEAAKGEGLRKSILEIYFKLQVKGMVHDMHRNSSTNLSAPEQQFLSWCNTSFLDVCYQAE